MDTKSLGLVSLTVIAGLAIMAAGIISGLTAWRRPEQSTKALLGLVEGANSIRLLTTFAIVVITSFLALADSLTEGPIALLSSVAGFMLGGIKRPSSADRNGGLSS